MIEPDDEALYIFQQLPITFKLSDEEVDKLRDAAQLLLNNDAEFQQLLKDRR